MSRVATVFFLFSVGILSTSTPREMFRSASAVLNRMAELPNALLIRSWSVGMLRNLEGDTIVMQGEVTLVHDDGTGTVSAAWLRRAGHDARGTPVAHRKTEGGTGTAEEAV
jgi:hypothetical protein